MPRIGPHKAEHISRSRQVLRTIFLERPEKGRLDAQHLTDIVDVEPQFLPLLAQELANRARLRRRRRRLVNGFRERRFDPLEYGHLLLSGFSILRDGAEPCPIWLAPLLRQLP